MADELLKLEEEPLKPLDESNLNRLKVQECKKFLSELVEFSPESIYPNYNYDSLLERFMHNKNK